MINGWQTHISLFCNLLASVNENVVLMNDPPNVKLSSFNLNLDRDCFTLSWFAAFQRIFRDLDVITAVDLQFWIMLLLGIFLDSMYFELLPSSNPKYGWSIVKGLTMKHMSCNVPMQFIFINFIYDSIEDSSYFKTFFA